AAVRSGGLALVPRGLGGFPLCPNRTSPLVPPGRVEDFPPTHPPALFQGRGMALGEDEFFYSTDYGSFLWTAWAKGLSAKSLVSIQQGRAQFEALFEGPASRAVQPLRQAP